METSYGATDKMASIGTVSDIANLPERVLAVFNQFYTAELTTVGGSGVPITWPIMPIFWERQGEFVTFTSIGLPQKALNIRRHPQVSLLFSEPMGSELVSPPAVLVQGNAEAPDRIMVARKDGEPDLWNVVTHQALKMLQRQPAMKIYLSNPLSRFLMDWYFMRLIIVIKPQRITWWEEGDFSRHPRRVEVKHVA